MSFSPRYWTVFLILSGMVSLAAAKEKRADDKAVPPATQGPPAQWGFSESVRVGKEHLRGQYGAASDAGIAHWREGSYPDLEKVLAQAATSPPSQAVEIRIHVAPEWRK